MSKDIANQLFLAYTGRPADVSWRSTTADLLKGSAPSVDVQKAFYNAAVLDGRFTLIDGAAGTVNKIFQNVFGFSASNFEQVAWAQLIDSGVISIETAAWTIFSSYLGATNVPASYQAPAQAKLVALDAYTNQLANDPVANLSLSILGGAASAAARSFVSSVITQSDAAVAIVNVQTTVATLVTVVTTTTTTTTTTKATTTTTAASPNLNFTAGTEDLLGTAGDDTFTGTTATVQAGDTLTALGGNDVMNVTYDGATKLTLPTNMTSLESIKFTGDKKGADFSGAATLASVTLDAIADITAGTTGYYTLRTGQDLTISNTTALDNTKTISIAQPTTNAPTSMNVTLSGTTTGLGGGATLDFRGAALTTLKITATAGADFKLADAGGALTAATFDGAAATSTIKFDASTLPAAAVLKVTTGSADDTVTALSTNIGATFDGKAGTDTLILKDTGVLTAANQTKLAAITGFEKLVFGASGSGLDFSNAAITFSTNNYNIGAGNIAATFTNSTSANAFIVDTSVVNTGTVSISNLAANTDATVTLDSGAGAGGALAGLTIVGAATKLDLTSQGAAANTITTLTVPAASTLNVKGAVDLTITNAVAATTINASTFTGKLNVKASGTATTFTGGSAADTLTGGAGNDTVNTSAGGDTVDAVGGTGDILNVISASHITATGASYKNFESLQLNAGVNLDVSLLVSGANAGNVFPSITINGGAGGPTGFTGMTAPQLTALTGGVIVKAGDASGISAGLDAAGTLKITADDGAGTPSTIALGTPTLTNVTTLTLVATDSVTISGLTGAASLTAINVTGPGTTTITTGANSTTNSISGTGTNAVQNYDATNSTVAAGVVFNGGGGADTLTGSGQIDLLQGNDGNDTINGNGGNDNINGGAGVDVMDGGIGSDTVSYVDVTSANAHALANIAGMAINLSGAAVTAATIATAMGGGVVIGGGAGVAGGNLAAGSAGYLATTAGNSTVTMVRDTLTNFESVRGSDLRDYIVAGSANGAINGGKGADYMVAGSASDTFTAGVVGESVVATANTFTAAGIANTNTITFGNSVDVITGFTSGIDKLDVTGAGGVAATTLAGVTTATALVAGATYTLRGSYVAGTGVFTVNTTAGADTLVVQGNGALTAVTATNYTVLVGVTATVAADFI